MLTLLALSTLAEVALTPTDDIWAYPHASDPKSDVYLRVWGVSGEAVAKDAAEAESFAYSLLRFDTSSLPKTKKLTTAILRLTHVGKPSFTVESAAKAPLEVRPVRGDFAEKTWKYDDLFALKLESTDKAIFGKVSPSRFPDEDVFVIEIDLMKGENQFEPYLLNADGSLKLALTSKLSVDQDRQTYKFFSKDAETASRRPQLILKFAD